MSSVIYNLNHKGVRLIDSQTAWVVGKNGKRRLNPQYQFVGRLDIQNLNYGYYILLSFYRIRNIKTKVK